MHTLLITLAGPQQAWGSRSRFAIRGTERAPTRSGVLGLVAAALGLERTDSLERFDALEFGVRIDQPGRIERDFQTARPLDEGVSMPLSQRYYLADAVFLAGLATDDAQLLDDIERALRHPRFPLYLGRRAFPPAGPIPVEVVPGPLREVLSQASWRASDTYRGRLRDTPSSLELLVDARPGETPELTLQDVPRSFDPRRRMHDWRDVVIIPAVPQDLATSAPRVTTASSSEKSSFVPTVHQPMLLVAEEEA